MSQTGALVPNFGDAVREVSTMAEPLAVVRSSRRHKWKTMARILCVDRRNVGKRGRGHPRKFPIMKQRNSSPILATTTDTSVSALSVTDSDIERRNWVLLNRGVDTIAHKVWELGKEVGGHQFRE